MALTDIEKLLYSSTFLISTATSGQWPEDAGSEVAFVGSSNVGKSSCINALTNQLKLAKTSKTPGRTQLINFFSTLDDTKRIVDLPGYGYAKVPASMKQAWRMHIEEYLGTRQALKGLILLVDSRHDLKTNDKQMIQFCADCGLPMTIVLTKSDKISKNQGMKAKFAVENYLKKQYAVLSLEDVILFSAQTKQNIDKVYQSIEKWML